ncbi:YybH family protein [Winogradskyella endarachnes]|uniref:DUF4440 domain-containing protein n=1 Tax=Winogradskyella endarachnes TaxID=2681965 RepID=A0A6L6U8R1_9FLAO|nr:nuclear transport factor 2 family protein [Winogradskyella endarachnes]MUU78730.1 DUF4440 domain-containing protein [Winogradskyella endarachnes]
MKRFILLLSVLFAVSCVSIKTDVTTKNDTTKTNDTKAQAEAGIRLVMQAQEIAWNNHDLEGFMEGYWRSDELKFYGSRGLTKGWNKTLQNYKKSYPTSAESGTLKFVINDISKIEGDNYWVMGEYHLSRQVGDANGVFMIIFKKINGSWKIVADMSC